MLRFSLNFVYVIIYFNLIAVEILYVGLALFSTELTILIISICFFYRFKNKDVTFSLKNLDKAILVTVLGMACWTIVHQAGDMLIYRVDTMFVNVFFGSKNSGRVGAISDLGQYIISASAILGGLFGPLIIREYANKRIDNVRQLVVQQSFIVGSIAATLCGILIGFSKIFLTLWLGIDFGNYYLWQDLKLIPLPFYAAAGVMSYVFRTWNFVKIPAIATVFVGFMNVASICLIGWIFGQTPEDAILLILLCGDLFNFVQSFALGSYCCHRLCNMKYRECVLIFSKILIVLLTTTIISAFMSFTMTIDSFLLMALLCTVSGLISYSLMFGIVYSKEDRIVLLSILYHRTNE